MPSVTFIVYGGNAGKELNAEVMIHELLKPKHTAL